MIIVSRLPVRQHRSGLGARCIRLQQTARRLQVASKIGVRRRELYSAVITQSSTWLTQQLNERPSNGHAKINFASRHESIG
jgi:hypothetical protein